MGYTILLAEDDREISEIIRLYLESNHYQVIEAVDGEEAWTLFSRESVDLAILDIMMPKLTGYEVLKRIRQTSNIPVIILSAKNENRDKILGLDIGADDYMTKPFEPLEIVARVKSNLRRYYDLGSKGISGARDGQLRVGNLSLDPEKMLVFKEDQPVHLTVTEFRVLHMLMAAPGQIFTRQQLYNQTGGDYLTADEQTMMVHISNLREKIEADPKNPAYIKTVRGAGYKLEKQD
ncbi:response regulator transcription factor [Streptococcus dentasini]